MKAVAVDNGEKPAHAAFTSNAGAAIPQLALHPYGGGRIVSPVSVADEEVQLSGAIDAASSARVAASVARSDVV